MLGIVVLPGLNTPEDALGPPDAQPEQVSTVL